MTLRFARDQISIGTSASRMVTLEMINRDDGTSNILRVIFPLGMQIQYGTRLIVQDLAPLHSPFAVCSASGCASDYDLTPAILVAMQSRQAVIVQAIDTSEKPLTAALRLDDLWTARHASEVIVESTSAERLTPWHDDRLWPEVLRRTY